jgi:RNA polymerase sigma-70 factor, ECF subfamily
MTALPTTEAIWSELSSDLRRFIRRRVSDDHLADDLLQETFVRIHRSIESLADAERLAAWLYTIARNVVHDHYRRSTDEPIALGDTDPAETTDDWPNQLHCRTAEWLEELVAQLPEKYREAVRLAEIDGLTQQEVADRLGLSLSGAKSRIQRGRVMFRSALEQCCRFEFDRRGNLMDVDPRPDRNVCRDCGE